MNTEEILLQIIDELETEINICDEYSDSESLYAYHKAIEIVEKYSTTWQKRNSKINDLFDHFGEIFNPKKQLK